VGSKLERGANDKLNLLDAQAPWDTITDGFPSFVEAWNP
jgi:hypothetical protein